MSDAAVSPERHPSVRVTYSGKRKKRRESTNGNGDHSDHSDSDDADANSPPAPSSEEGEKTTSPTAKQDSTGTPAVPPPPTSTPVRPPPSRSPATPSTSAVKATSTAPDAPPQSPRDSIDDGASETGYKARKRKNESDRMQFIKDDPHCGTLEPYRAFCKKCNNWIVLHHNRRYVMKNWVTHRKSDCKIIVKEDGPRAPSQPPQSTTQTPAKPPSQPAAPQTFTVPPMASLTPSKPPSQSVPMRPPISPVYSLPVAYTTRPLSVVYPSSVHGPSIVPAHSMIGVPAMQGQSTTVSFPQPYSEEARKREEARVSKEEKRKARLVSDPLAAVVQAHEVKCKLCNEWVKLAPTSRYSAPNWVEHRETLCPARQQSPFVAEPAEQTVTAQSVHSDSDSDNDDDLYGPAAAATADAPPGFSYFQELLRDPQLKLCTKHEIRCRHCLMSRAHVGDIHGSYTWWQSHKQTCTAPPPENPPSSSFTFFFPSAVFGSSPTKTVPKLLPPEPLSGNGDELSDDGPAGAPLSYNPPFRPGVNGPWFLTQKEERDPTLIALCNELQNDPEVGQYNRWKCVCGVCGHCNMVTHADDFCELVEGWRRHKKEGHATHQGAASLSSWLAKLWPYGRSHSQSQLANGTDTAATSRSESTSSPTPTTSRKRAREDDEEGDAMQNGRAVRPRRDSTAGGGLWRKLSQTVVGLVDGVRAGYAAASASSMEE